MSSPAPLRRYAAAIAMWQRGFDTAAIAEALALPGATVERWMWNFREQARAAA
jgi:hypothetical protein